MLRAKVAHHQRTAQKGADLSDFATVVLDSTNAEALTAASPFISILGPIAGRTCGLMAPDPGRCGQL